MFKIVTLSLFFMCQFMAHEEFQDVRQGDIIEISGQKALVFDVDESGQHGLAMCIKAFRGVESPLCNNSRYLKKLPDMYSEVDGKLNTTNVIEYAEKQKSLNNFPYFNWCRQLGEGWYSPSRKELELFVNYWLGNYRIMNWNEENEDVDVDNLNMAHYKMVNQKILDAGGVPFMTDVYTSTIDSDKHVYVFKFKRFWKHELIDNSWEITKIKVSSIDEKFVGRAIIKF